MDAAVQLALMAKAKMVFETPGSFLSFPVLSPLSFRPAQLDFSHALGDPAVGGALEDFSRAVNRCPSDPIARSDGDDYLWDRYDAWLTAMLLAGDQLDPASQSAYDAARSLLVVRDANGFETDSPTVVTYKQCRDAAINAQQAYKAAQITATEAGNAAALADWQSNQAPQLQSAIDAANATWIATGHKTEVEAAQSTLAQSEARMPHAVWGSWRAMYSPDVDGITDPASNARYVPSGFAPSDMADQAWTTLNLSGPEIAALAAGAPAALRTLFGDVGTSTIASISFEFRSAAVVRPWFRPAMFGARFWKFGDGSQLSDGAAPPTGAWPAYVTGVIFVRNVQVTDAQAPTRPMPVAEFVQFAMHVPPGLIAQPPLGAAAPPIVMRAGPVAATRPTAALGAVAAKPFLAATQPTMMVPIQRVPVVNPSQPRNDASNPLLRLDGAIYRIPHPPMPTTTGSLPPSPPAPSPAPPAPDDSIAILAYICGALPKSPDPDPSLSWS